MAQWLSQRAGLFTAWLSEFACAKSNLKFRTQPLCPVIPSTDHAAYYTHSFHNSLTNQTLFEGTKIDNVCSVTSQEAYGAGVEVSCMLRLKNKIYKYMWIYTNKLDNTQFT